MNLAAKAALYNVLLFPGWGQIYLKMYKKGIAIMIAVIAGAISILWSIVQTTTAFLKISPFRKNAVNFNAVVKTAIYSIKHVNRSYLMLMLSLILLLWILSVVDAYNLGKKQQSIPAAPDKTDSNSDTDSSPVSN
ncbi:MAG TPA: DUF5683 domain-containing protein [Smithella sp.]|nr:DUF5683 domain-containing protein [Smithella sp.]